MAECAPQPRKLRYTLGKPPNVNFKMLAKGAFDQITFGRAGFKTARLEEDR